ncbi:MAG: AraC family transcriptional regulator [Clostridiales bacterium]|jgi:AraC-like DNA-binding protein/mannose-6-phosphate isomerase-like protein (cupin superfamily)|nr:AraC family transcriptional regulator [Clostridiales bacterium]
MNDPIYYWPVELSKSNFPVKISKRNNSSQDNRDPNFALHWHEQLEFYYVLEGGIYLTCNGEEQWVYKNDVAFANWCDLHRSIAFLDNTNYYVFQIDLSLLTSDKDDIFTEKYGNNLIVRSQNFERFIHQDSQISQLFEEIIKEYETQHIGFEMIVKSLFLRVTGLIFRNHFHYDKSVALYDPSVKHTREILRYIAYHYNTCNHLDVLAAQVGITKNYMCRIFKEHTGCTIIHYINQLRCYKAMSLIADGVSVTQAAMEVGYSDYNYFSRVFKQVVGFSPSKTARKKKET